MDNLRKSIEIVFSKNCPDSVLIDSNHYGLNLDSENIFPSSQFKVIGTELLKNNSHNEINNLFQKLSEDWFYDVYQEQKSKRSIYNLLIHFNKQVLDESNKSPIIRNEHLLRWREMSLLLGEDIFTCSFFAYMDNRSSRERNYFSWSPVIRSNNNRLKKLLNQGLAENHFHLKGSGPVFELAWLAVMNQPSEMMLKFNSLKKEFKLNAEITTSFSTSKKDIAILVYKAAIIRFELFKEVCLGLKSDQNGEIDQLINKPSNEEDSLEIKPYLSDLQKDLDLFKSLYSYNFKHKHSHAYADYCIPNSLSELNFEGSVLLFGERNFLYRLFKKLYSQNTDNSRIAKLFYAYLLIKNQFRAELIQVNKKVGFSNFLAYQERKELFLPENSIYDTAFLSMAVNDSKKFQNIVSFELRIAPKKSSIEIFKNFKSLDTSLTYDSIAENGYIKNYFSDELPIEKNEFYTIHFIKKKDKLHKKELVSMLTCKDSQLRQEVKEQAIAIVNLRESYSSKSKLIRGIDAASSEFDARPEVFAQAFRYLKDHKLKGKYNFLKTNSDNKEFKLYSTYHAGEDFFDIADGLRTIDEVIKFLNFKQGDRIGHALALGISPKDYYGFKGRKLMIPKGILIDNIAWLIAQIRKANIHYASTELDRLKKKFESLFYELYQQKSSIFKNTNVSIDQYHNAWKLRGDDPELYKIIKDDIEIDTIPNMTYWERCRINHSYPLKFKLRKHAIVKQLYQAYHFDPTVKHNSEEICQFEITDNYIKLVTDVQKHMQRNVMELNLGIECNPTSNYLIGTFKRYDKHPIIDFYNLGLETDPLKIKESCQLFVSINTDDQGIFGTSLENEFALMAIALEKATDENGVKIYKPSMIYDWLDRIRKMGLEQSFKDSLT